MTTDAAPERLLFWAMAYKLSELLMLAERDGALAALERGVGVEELAGATGWRPDSAAIVLTLLGRAGLVEHDAGRYRLSPELTRYRVLLALEQRLHDWHRSRDSLRRALVSDETNDPLDDLDDPAFVAAFAQAMAATARETALRVRKIIGSAGAARVVDLGGGDGSVAAELAGLLPAARFRVVDRPALHPAFQARADGANHRIEFIAGDLRDAVVVAGAVRSADLILLLNVAHLLADHALDRLLHAARGAAKPGATLVVRDMFRQDDGPLALTDLMLVDWLRCGARFCDDIADFLSLIHI